MRCCYSGQLLRYVALCGSVSVLTCLFWLLAGCGGATAFPTAGIRLAEPPVGKVYLGVYPGGMTGDENDITLNGVEQFERLAGSRVAWVYFSQNWFQGREFPMTTATWIRAHGAVPFIRLQMRSTDEPDQAETAFTLQAIIHGTFDADLRAWAQAAHAFGTALLVEYGTECNGQWFPWNGAWNGGGETLGFGDSALADGPERFCAAYRHIVTLMRAEGADNIAWVFHVNDGDDPDVAWNRFEHYYPGDDVVDWIGVSCYGPQTPFDSYDGQTFRQRMDAVYPRLAALSGTKPLAVLEFGCTAGSPGINPTVWTPAALRDLLGRRWPRIAGVSYWNERWQNDDNPAHDSILRLQDIPTLATAFAQTVRASATVQAYPVYESRRSPIHRSSASISE